MSLGKWVASVTVIDPARIRSSEELAEQLAELFDRDPRSQRRFASDAGLSPATVRAVITGAVGVPRAATLDRFVRACGRDPGPWRAARARLVAAQRAARVTASTRSGEPVQRWEPVIGELGERAALQLGVQRAFAARRAVPVLPAYLPRAGFDDRLRQAVAQAANASLLIMVVGEPATGKTRACWAAVGAELPGWRVWHPPTPDRSPALVAALRGSRVAARTVIWLDQAQHYLYPPQAGEQVAAELDALLSDEARGPVLVLGSMWPMYWGRLYGDETAYEPNPRPAAFRLCLHTELIEAPHAFTATQVADLADTIAEDPRLRTAVRRAPGGRITQELTGAPELLRRYRHADPAARAVLWAAMDACRLGHGPYLPGALLEQAAPGYLDAGTRARFCGQRWFGTALDDLTAQRQGLPGPLSEHWPGPGEPPGPLYRLASYLDRHGHRERALLCPPVTFWHAAARHAHTPADLAALAAAAYRRGRYRHADRLARRSAGAGNTAALWNLVLLRDKAGDRDGAEHLARRAVDGGHTTALYSLALLREKAGDTGAARRLYRQAADTGHTAALCSLALLLEGAGDREGARRLCLQAAEAGYTGALFTLVLLLEKAGDHDGAEQAARQAADAGETEALFYLAARWEIDRRDRDGAQSLYRYAVDAGDTRGLSVLALLRERAGDRDGAERLARQAAGAGDSTGLEDLARRRWEAGDRAGAERLTQEAADAGATLVLWDMARRHWEAGDRVDAERLTQQAADAGYGTALVYLARLRYRDGDRDGAERLVQQAADAGDALTELARLHWEMGDRDGAERLAHQAADAGQSTALEDLARLRYRDGDRDGAERFAHQAADAEDTSTLSALAGWLERAGDRDGAERLYRQAVDGGNSGALEELKRLWREAGDRDGAERLARFGLSEGGAIEDPWSP